MGCSASKERNANVVSPSINANYTIPNHVPKQQERPPEPYWNEIIPHNPRAKVPEQKPQEPKLEIYVKEPPKPKESKMEMYMNQPLQQPPQYWQQPPQQQVGINYINTLQEQPPAYQPAQQQTTTQKVEMVLPPGVFPGQQITVNFNGTNTIVVVPAGVAPGQKIRMEIPVAASPPSSAPLASAMQSMIERQELEQQQEQDNERLRLVEQENERLRQLQQENERRQQEVDEEIERQRLLCDQQQANARQRRGSDNAVGSRSRDQAFEVLIPHGVEPGSSFALMANGLKMMVEAPLDSVPGDKVRFHVPISDDEQLFETVCVKYDMDGWMRCLGQDYLFHWVFNTSDAAQLKLRERAIFFDENGTAFARKICRSSAVEFELKIIPAGDYAMDTSIPLLPRVDHSVLSKTAALPFDEKMVWLRRQFDDYRIAWEDGRIHLEIDRNNLLHSTMSKFSRSTSPEDMRKIIRFNFRGEEGIDAGGLARDFYLNVDHELFNPAFGLFSYSAVNQMCMQINPDSAALNKDHLLYYHLAGRLLGKALMDNQIVPVHLVQPLYKHLLGYPVTLKDLQHVDDEVYNNLNNLLDIEDISLLCLDFTVSSSVAGKVKVVDLIDGGADVDVTNFNVTQFLRENIIYRLFTRIQPQLTELVRGFQEVVPEPLLSVFDFQDLELLLHGLPNIDLEDWKANTRYGGEFKGSKSRHKVVKWFWEIVESYSQEEKAKLLQFSTGTSGVPAQGFAYLQGVDGSINTFKLLGSADVKLFPRSHTCFNRIDMPMYTSKADMKKYLTLAINETAGFGMA